MCFYFKVLAKKKVFVINLMTLQKKKKNSYHKPWKFAK